jgi:hypothetical protein
MAHADEYATPRKPERPSRPRRAPLARILVWGGVVMLAGIILVVAWHVVGTAKSGPPGMGSTPPDAT